MPGRSVSNAGLGDGPGGPDVGLPEGDGLGLAGGPDELGLGEGSVVPPVVGAGSVVGAVDGVGLGSVDGPGSVVGAVVAVGPLGDSGAVVPGGAVLGALVAGAAAVPLPDEDSRTAATAPPATASTIATAISTVAQRGRGRP
jgi:hypothetical protein